MNRRIVAILLLLAAIGLWIVSRPAPSILPPLSPPAPAVPVAQSDPRDPVLSPAAPDLPPNASPALSPTIDPKARPRNLANPLVPSTIPGVPPTPGANIDPATDIDFDKISVMLRDYRTLFGENPVGTNAEIMHSIMGGNPKGAMLGPPEGQSLNEDGELLDRWGSPVFFHQLSADRMELRSAGPDRTLWTADDLVR